MKKRTFFTTLLLFLLFMNVIFLVILSVMLRDRIANIKERSLSENYVISAMLLKDMQALTDRQIFTDENLLLSLQQYFDMLRDQKSCFVLYDGNSVIFQNKESDIFQNKEIQKQFDSLEVDTRYTGFHEGKPERFYILGKLAKPYDRYTLYYDTDIEEDIGEWKNFRLFLFGAGCAFSLMLAVCLLILMQRIFGPLIEISKISAEIADGRYEKRLPVKGHDELTDMAVSFNNMADKIQNQLLELNQSARQKQEFIDNFAHELKTPLTAIFGYAEYLQKAVTSEEERQEAADYILSECRRVQNMAKQLMDLVVLRESEFSIQVLNVKQLLEETQAIMLPKALKKGVCIEYQHKLNSLKGDSGLLKHLLTNIISNAIQSCEKDGIIKVTAYLSEKGACIQIKDNGRGMNKEELTHITEAFYRVEKSRSREEGKAGLGLAICCKIAEILNIEMEFQSEQGQGTTVLLYFTSS